MLSSLEEYTIDFRTLTMVFLFGSWTIATTTRGHMTENCHGSRVKTTAVGLVSISFPGHLREFAFGVSCSPLGISG